jgi:hypothetical protein
MPAVDRFNFPITYDTRAQAVKTGRFTLSVFGAASAKLYYFRAFDSGTAGYVYWGPYNEPEGHSTPSSTETTPNYTGSLSGVNVWLVR